MTELKEVSYEQIRQLGGPKSLLLGNGFSIALDASFGYGNLLDEADKCGLPGRAKDVFNELRTANFEEFLRAMDLCIKVAELYGCEEPCTSRKDMVEERDSTRSALVDAIVKVHGAYPNRHSLKDDQKEACCGFLADYKHIYTLSYDLLLYWVFLYGVTKNKWPDGSGDGCVAGGAFGHLSDVGGIRFLHGALHFQNTPYGVRKLVYKEKPLLEELGGFIANGNYPLFIAEGTSLKKKLAIDSNKYLSECFREFSAVPRILVTYGVAFSDSDDHLLSAIQNNPNIKDLFVGYYGETSEALRIKLRQLVAEKKGKLRCNVWDVSKVNPWTQNSA